LEIVRVWMTTDFLADQPKYRNRVDKIVEIAEMYVRHAPYEVTGEPAPLPGAPAGFSGPA
jgi:hypothetical protein